MSKVILLFGQVKKGPVSRISINQTLKGAPGNVKTEENW